MLCSASEGQVRGGQNGKQGAVQEARKRKRERRGGPSDRSKRKKHETRVRSKSLGAISTKKEARKEGQSQRKKQAKEARNKKLEARIKKQERTSDKHEKGSEKGGAVPAKEASERSTKQEDRSKN